jgi:hypothetical protein
MKTWQTQKMKVSQLTPANYNPRKISDRALQGLQSSIERFGMVEPIVWNQRTGNIVGGHQRLKVLKDKGVEETDVVVVDFDSNEEVALNVTLNNPSIQGEYTQEVGGLLKSLEGQLGDAFGSLRMDDLKKSLSGLLAKDRKGSIDAVPQISRAAELNKKWQVKSGDLWRIGEHRLLCGDSTKAEDVGRVMGGEKSSLLVTSPPYWVGKEYEREKTWEQVQKFIGDCVVAWSPFLTHRAVINTGAPQAAHLTGLRAHIRLLLDDWVREFAKVGMLLRYVRIWTKTGGLCHTKPESDCVDQHWEFVATFYRPETFEGQRRLNEPWATNGIWDDIPGVPQTEHSAPFHIELPSRNIRLHTDEGAIIFEPFCGSGTTMVACENLGRKCRGIEISPDYCSVILQRIQDAFSLVGEKIE